MIWPLEVPFFWSQRWVLLVKVTVSLATGHMVTYMETTWHHLGIQCTTLDLTTWESLETTWDNLETTWDNLETTWDNLETTWDNLGTTWKLYRHHKSTSWINLETNLGQLLDNLGTTLRHL